MNVLINFVRTDQSKTAAFERLLVRNQLYDVLAYAHRSHGPPPTMLFELRKAAIVSLCLSLMLLRLTLRA